MNYSADKLKALRSAFDIQANACSPNYTNRRRDKLGNLIEFRLTFDEWLAVWTASGKLHERGHGADAYCMARVNDVGHYELGNVVIKTNRDNVIEAKRGTSPSTEQRQRFADAMRGKKYRNLTCPHCQLTGGANGLKRYHFDNCKQRPTLPPAH